MMKRCLLVISLLAILLPILFMGLMSNETGSRWLLKGIFSLVPGQIVVEETQGRLIDRVTLTGVSYNSGTETVVVDTIDLRWQPLKLLTGNLKINELALQGLTINIVKSEEEDNKPVNIESLIKLPIGFDIGSLLMTDVRIKTEGQDQAFDKLQLSAKTEANQLKLLSLTVTSETIQASAKGTVKLEKQLPLNIQAEWRVNAANNSWQGNTSVNGDIDKLLFNNSLVSPFDFKIFGQVEDVLKTTRIKAQGNWQNLRWPVTGNPPQIQSEQGHFELNGMPDNYQLTVNGQLKQQYIPQATLAFDGMGDLNAMVINKLKLKSSSGLFQLNGNVSWVDTPIIDLSAKGQNFNPAIIVPELPGNLTFSSRIKGDLNPEAMQLTAEIDKLNGRLRNQPINANGTISLVGDQLQVDSFQAAMGANKAKFNGHIGKSKGTLDFTTDMPELSALWPTLGGSLKSQGELQGGWENPSVKLDANANRLKFGQHGLKKLAVTVDYHSNNQENSTVNIIANDINSGNILVNKLSIVGKGTLIEHVFKADVHSPHEKLSTALNGSFKGSQWKGDLTQLSLTLKDGKAWALKDKTVLAIEKKPLGFEVNMAEGCLVQQSASLCTQGSYLADGDLSFQLLAKALPVSLVNPYLTNGMVIESRLNAEADIHRKKGVFKGTYQATTTPVQISIKTRETRQEIHLGASALTGAIQGDKVSAVYDVKLANRDYVQGKLLMDLGKLQSISGSLSTSIAELSLLKPFIPGVSDIKGQLKADLDFNGALTKPQVSGQIDLSNAQVDTESLGLHDLNLHAVAMGNLNNNISLQGSMTPIIINKPGSAEKINLNTRINLNADMQVQDKIEGNFSLTTSEATTLTLITPKRRKKMELGSSLISGRLKDETLVAELNMALAGQDYLRVNLQMDTDNTQLSARATASIQDFAIVEAFVPQLSQIKGQLKADVTAKGTAQNPTINSNVQLSSGSVTVDELGINVSDIRLHAVTMTDSPDVIQIKGSAKSGGGHVDINGSVNLQPESYPVDIRMTGKDFEIAKIPEAQIAVSPDLKITLSEQLKQVSGQLEVPKAIIKIQEIPEGAVRVSEDEVILGEQETTDQAPPMPGLNTDIEVKLGKQVSFTGQGLQANLVGSLKIIKKGEKMTLQGNVDMKEASYKRFGQDLTVRKGRFSFNGPADNPWLDVEAIRVSKSKKVTAILALTGPLKNPQTRISSEPSLPESEALAYLVTGNPLSQVSKSESNALANAALSYGAGKMTWLAEKFGIDEFKLEEGAKLQDSLLVMGQYLTPDFYVGTKVGMFNKQASLVLKHKLTENFNVETQAGTSQRIKLNYEFDGN
jgi:autotransporter translocation and assembly factor TamB